MTHASTSSPVASRAKLAQHLVGFNGKEWVSVAALEAFVLERNCKKKKGAAKKKTLCLRFVGCDVELRLFNVMQ